MSRFHATAITVLALIGGSVLLHADGLNPAAQTRLDQIRDEAVSWAADPSMVDAVVGQNRQLPAELADLTEEKWGALPEKSPLVKKFINHPAAQILRTKGAGHISEAFISDAAGLKVAFLSKPTSWSHSGKPKHEVPMSGKFWQGRIEVDRSAGSQQIQISVPVLSGGKPVGSLVIGVSVGALAGG